MSVYGKTGVCLPMTPGQALRAAAGMGADDVLDVHGASMELADNMIFTPPTPRNGLY
jgi:hypothetical protein